MVFGPGFPYKLGHSFLSNRAADIDRIILKFFFFCKEGCTTEYMVMMLLMGRPWLNRTDPLCHVHFLNHKDAESGRFFCYCTAASFKSLMSIIAHVRMTCSDACIKDNVVGGAWIQDFDLLCY